jgi:hypothetical protein
MTTQSRQRSEAFGRRVLHLLETLRGPGDLAPDRLQATLGEPVVTDPDDPGTYGIGEVLDPRWILNLVTVPNPQGGAPTRIVFSCDDQTGRYDDLSDVCALDLGAWTDALTAAGYTSRPHLGPRSAFYGVWFERGDVSVEAIVRAVTPAEPDRLCVSMLVIDTEARHAAVV